MKKFNYEIYKEQRIGWIECKDMKTVVFFVKVDHIDIDVERLRGMIPEQRFDKMMKYKRKIDKQLLVGNELLFEFGLRFMRPLLLPGEIKRAVCETGKPYIKDIADLHFNMSHAGNYSVCAFSDRPIGVDVERVEELDLSIAEAYFRESEYQDIVSRGCMKEKLACFFDYWVLKESFVKSIGLGLSIQLNAFAFVSTIHEQLRVVQDIDDKCYISQRLPFEENYKLAICRECG